MILSKKTIIFMLDLVLFGRVFKVCFLYLSLKNLYLEIQAENIAGIIKFHLPPSVWDWGYGSDLHFMEFGILSVRKTPHQVFHAECRRTLTEE